MATTVAVLEAQLRADTRQFNREMGQADTTMGKAKKGIHKSALAIGTAVATGLGVVAKIGFDEFKQGALVTAQTNAVIKSTGGVANVTAKHVAELSESLMKKSGVDDEAIASGQNMLLTFKQIRNEAGAGNDIFDQATKATLDLSVAMGKDMTDSSILVGKALNDPIKGLSALRRVGIQFTAAQEKQIKKMVEAGNVAGAQKLILKELESQFGGSAEAAGKTLPGQLNILKESFNNFAGELVKGAIPKLKAVVDLIREHSGLAKVAAGIIAGFAAAILVVSAAMRVYQAGIVVATALQWLWNIAMSANPVGLIVIAIAALAVGLVVAYKKSETFRKIVHGAFAAVKAVAVGTFNWIRKNWPLLLAILGGPIGLAALLIFRKFGAIKGAVGDAWNFVRTKTAAVWDWVRDKITAVLNRIRDVLANVRDTARFTFEFFRDKVQIVIDVVKAVIEKLKDMVAYIKSIPGKIKGALGSVGGFFSDIVGKVGDATGDIRAIDFVSSVGRKGVNAALNPAMGLARAMGLSVSSTYRPGATVAGSGRPSDHGVYPSKAVDFAGSASQMNTFARRVAGIRGVETVIYSPVGLWKGAWGAIRSAITKADHYDHVHVDTFDRGGWLKPGWTLAGNFTGRPERIGGGGGDVHFHLPNYVGSKQELMSWLRNAVREFERRNGRAAF